MPFETEFWITSLWKDLPSSCPHYWCLIIKRYNEQHSFLSLLLDSYPYFWRSVLPSGLKNVGFLGRSCRKINLLPAICRILLSQARLLALVVSLFSHGNLSRKSSTAKANFLNYFSVCYAIPNPSFHPLANDRTHLLTWNTFMTS